MADTQTGLDLRDIDIPELLDEVGETLVLVREIENRASNPTQNKTEKELIEVQGLIFNATDYYGNPLSAAGERQIIISVKDLDKLPAVADSIKDKDGIVYKITDVMKTSYAGITVIIELKAVC